MRAQSLFVFSGNDLQLAQGYYKVYVLFTDDIQYTH
jgi:hypothetical protein